MKGKAAALSVHAQRCQSHYFSTTRIKGCKFTFTTALPYNRLNNIAYAVVNIQIFLIHPDKIFLKAETCSCLCKKL